VPNPFVHLHLHTEYSLLDGIQKIRPLLQRISDFKMPACAITDHGSMAGAYEFWATCKEFNIKPLLGCEVYVAERTRLQKEAGIDNKRTHLTLLAQNQEGYHNLLKMVSIANLDGFYYKPRVDKELLEKYGKGVIALSGCLSGKMNRLLLRDKDQEALEWLEFIKSCFSKVYVEMGRIGIEEAEALVPRQVAIAKKAGLDYVATCDSHYLDQEDYKIQEIAWCISDGKKLADPGRRQYASSEFYVKSSEAMQELFKDLPDAIANTNKIAETVEQYSIEYQRIQPKWDVKLDNEQTKDLLNKHVFDKIKLRYPKVTPEIKKRVDYELGIIDQKGYNDYFLVVEDYIAWARSKGILVGPGRGSGAGSVAAYVLGITNLDPFKWDLIFERFLNPERPSPPDFDVDFQDDRRDELFEYMSNKYGKENTSFVGTFGRLKTKAAIRDVARVMGIDLSVADRLSKMVIVKFGKVYPIAKMRTEVKEFDDMIKASPDLEQLSKYVAKLENVARHISIHACGYLVTPTPITDYVPVQIEPKADDKKITQFEGMHLEPIGLMKFDFLGLTNLTIIAKALKLIEEQHKIIIDIDKIPLDDAKTFKLFQDGNTGGIFQFESDGMRKYLRDLQPTEIEDLIFLNAAYRPGPMAYIPGYIARKQGREKVEYPHESLEPVLKTTLGYAIYQEQVITTAVVFAGYSLGEADMLRRAMGKKKKEVMDKEKDKFIKKSIEKGHSEALAKKIFSYLEPFADYGFNRSHSACYSMIAYQTAYLKANYPSEFLASLMEVDCHTPDKLQRDLKASQDMKIAILPPDINHSSVHFTIQDGNQIRFGLSGIKGGGARVMESIVKARPKQGFRSLQHLIEKVGPDNLSKKDLECLIKVGAMDKFGYRNQLLEALPMVFEGVVRFRKNAEGGQSDLFGSGGDTVAPIHEDPLPRPREEREIDRLNWEKELLGTFLSKHPLENYRDMNAGFKLTPLARTLEFKDKTPFAALALITRIKIFHTKKDGKAMAFVTLEDIDAKVDGVIFPRDYEKLRNVIKEYLPVVIKGSVNYKDDVPSLVIDAIMEPEELHKKKELEINICGEQDQQVLVKLKELLKRNQDGDTKLKIVYGEDHNRKYLIKNVAPVHELLEFIEKYNCK
jgi:DNA polymerase III subunit alpha